MYAEYDVINVRDHQVKKIVGSFHYDAVSNKQSKLYVLYSVQLVSIGKAKNEPENKQQSNIVAWKTNENA